MVNVNPLLLSNPFGSAPEKKASESRRDVSNTRSSGVVDSIKTAVKEISIESQRDIAAGGCVAVNPTDQVCYTVADRLRGDGTKLVRSTVAGGVTGLGDFAHDIKMSAGRLPVINNNPVVNAYKKQCEKNVREYDRSVSPPTVDDVSPFCADTENTLSPQSASSFDK